MIHIIYALVTNVLNNFRCRRIRRFRWRITADKQQRRKDQQRHAKPHRQRFK